jgi:hypothetical protein
VRNASKSVRKNITPSLSASYHHVIHIFPVSPLFQMFGVKTRWIMALVSNFDALLDGAI